jgi:hypothetical protein
MTDERITDEFFSEAIEILAKISHAQLSFEEKKQIIAQSLWQNFNQGIEDGKLIKDRQNKKKKYVFF